MKKTQALTLLGLLVSGTATANSKIQVPLFFIENQGQMDSGIVFYLPGKDKNLFFDAQGVTYSLQNNSEKDSRWNVTIGFVNADSKTKPEGQSPLPAKISYFKGPRSDWKTGIKTYNSLKYSDLWKGIDLVYAGHPGHVEHRFIVKPGADPQRIQMSYRGAEKVSVSPIGSLKVETAAGGFEEGGLFAYQEKDGKREQVAANFVVEKASGENVVGFKLGRYDRERPLIIDPEVLIYSGFIGGGGLDQGKDIAVDGAGNAYVVGDVASSAYFPKAVGPSLDLGGQTDVFVAKVAPDGATLLYAGFIGGEGNDYGAGIAVGSDGSAYVTGNTSSTESFPAVVGPGDYPSGQRDAFVTKISPDGSSLVYSGFIGGNGEDFGWGIAVGASGSAVITGETSSSDGTFPEKAGPDLSHNGGRDAFVAKVASNGASLLYAGFLGGNADDIGYDVAVDGTGSAYVTGVTKSSSATFPTEGGLDPSANGLEDAFVTKLSSSGSIVYSGFIGGQGNDRGSGIAVDTFGNAYITGSTSSATDVYPRKVGPDLTANGNYDAFVAKIAAGGTSVVYNGFIGGSGEDRGSDIAVDGAGNAYVTGYTAHTATNTFPVLVGPDLTRNGNFDAFLAKVAANGASLLYSGFIGGDAVDYGYGVAVDASGNAYVVGTTSSGQSSFGPVVGPDLSFNGGGDAFVTKFGLVVECGDGVKEGSEVCDDGNTDNGDACLNTCVSATCGDGVVDAAVEECDEGGANSDTAPDACRTNCANPVCGDGAVDTGEGCDTGDGAEDTCASGSACVAPGGVNECACQGLPSGTDEGTTGGTADGATGGETTGDGTSGGTSGDATGGSGGSEENSGDGGGCSLIL